MSARKEASAYKAEGGIPGTEWTAGSSNSSMHLSIDEQEEPLDLSMKHKPADSVLTMKPLSDNIKVDMSDDQLVSENDTSSRRNGERLKEFHISRVDVDDNPERRNSMTTNDESRLQSSDSTPNKSKDITGEDALGQNRPFICQFLCGYRSKYKWDVEKHERIHTGAKPFICSVDRCGKRFRDSSNLATHSLIHTGEKPFVCKWDGCGKRFNQSSHLSRHMKTHTGEIVKKVLSAPVI